MQYFLQQLINGISEGSLYGLLGISIVLILRVSGVANFAAGEIGMLSTFAGYFASTSAGLPGWVAFVVAITTGVLVSVFVYFLILAPRRGSVINLTIRTLGLDAAILAAVAALWAGNEPYPVQSLVPIKTINIGSFQFSTLNLTILCVTAILVLILQVLFTRSRLGLQMRALAENSDWARLAGVNPLVVVGGTWAIAGLVAAVAAGMYAPLTYLSTGMMVPFLVKTFAAAVLGGLDNWHGVLIGGFVIGIIDTFVGVYASYLLQPAIAFGVLALVLLLKPEGLFGKSGGHRV
jgi:branched-chain amino acid transport system permease protein